MEPLSHNSYNVKLLLHNGRPTLRLNRPAKGAYESNKKKNSLTGALALQ